MKLLKLIARNAMRHKLRTSLTIFGLAIAVLAFIIIRASIGAWYAQSEAASPNRLITRNAVSLVFTMPMSYRDRMLKVDGVTGVSYSQWFGGKYIDDRNFFAQFAIDHETYFEMYPEFVIEPEAWRAFESRRNAVIVGRKLADRFGWEIGDNIQLIGTIFPGDWDFEVVGIYTGAEENTDESTWYFRFDYLDERMKQDFPGRAGQVGGYHIQIADPSEAARVSQEIDALFVNSSAETLTETEEAFQLSFVEMASAIITGLEAISVLVIGIILLVLANTMAMTARERVNEYAVMKTLGFRPYHLAGFIMGESLFIAAVGAGMGLLLTIPAKQLVGIALSTFFPVFNVSMVTMVLAVTSAIVVGIVSAIFPTAKAVRTPIVEGLRIID